jgi:hypothetical protein
VTLPTAVRLRRAVPEMLVIHYADLGPDDVESVEGVPVTTPVRTIRDAHASQLGSEIVSTAIADGRRSGKLGLGEADALERELLGTEASGLASTVGRCAGGVRAGTGVILANKARY